MKDHTILVVEDDPVIGSFLQTVFDSEGYRSTLVAEGDRVVEEALRLNPDLVTLDLALPRLDGVSVLHRLKEVATTRQIPVVVISAYTDRLSGSDRSRVAAIVPKPFDVDQLLDTVHRVLSANDAVRTHREGDDAGAGH